MTRESLFSMLKKIAYIVLIVQVGIIVLDRTMTLPPDLVNTIRFAIMIIFIVTSLALPVVKRASIWFQAISVIGLLLFITGLLFPRFSIFVVIAILIGVFILVASDYFGQQKNEKHKNKNTDTNEAQSQNQEHSQSNKYIQSQVEESLPLPGPSARAGEAKTYVKYYVSMTIAFFNPFQFWQMIMQTVGLMRSSNLKDFEQKGEYTLPFEGEWLVFNGGIDKENSHSWDILNQRYAYDFVIADSSNNRHINDGDELTDYFCYGQPILSPGDGQVIKVRDGIRDYPRPGTMMIDYLTRDFRGNFVIIKHEENEYSVLAHFIPGSIEVKKGDDVKKGQRIGKCGNSGHSTEPHLHFHFQDHPNFYFGVGLPMTFSNLKVNGDYTSETHIKKGQRVVLSDE